MTSQPQIQLLIADDHEIMRSGLVSLIKELPTMGVVGEARNGREAIKLVRETQPDVILLDVSLGDMSGVDAIKQFRKDAPQARILVLTMHEDKTIFFQALQAGASGYFLKGNPTAELFNAIEAIAQGGVYLPPQLAGELVNDYLHRCQVPADKPSLTNREEEVVSYMVKGLSNREIATRLTVSPSTVKVHCYNIFQKLNLDSRSDLVSYAEKHGFLN
ncbi:MAG: response regulator [Anaerolineae bacterium]